MGTGASAKATSLARRGLLRIAIRVALIFLLVSAIGFLHVRSVLRERSVDALLDHVQERGDRESALFLQVEENHEVIRDEFVKRLAALGDADPIEAFEEEFERLPDDTIRSRLDGFDGSKQAFGFFGRDFNVDAVQRRIAMVALELSNDYGPSWHQVFQNIYFTTPSNSLVGYWPEVPNWAHAAKADLFMPAEEYVSIATPKSDPLRKTVWTGLFFDVVGKVWMVSAETPIDYQGQHIATLGYDITLNELLERTRETSLEGAYNVIFRDDGRLISYPGQFGDQEVVDRALPILERDERKLQRIYRSVLEHAPRESAFELAELGVYVAVTRIAGPDWYFATVYPEALVSGPAFDVAKIILLLGACSLLLELLVIAWVLRRDVARPLEELSTIAGEIADGNYDRKLAWNRSDELGRLAASVDIMSSGIAARRDELELRVEERTQDLRAAQKELVQKERLAALGTLSATVSHELRNPLGIIRNSLFVVEHKTEGKDLGIAEALGRINQGVERCSSIITQMLEFAREPRLALTPVDFDHCLEQFLQTYELPPAIALESALAATDALVLLDAERFRQVLINLLDNARDAILETAEKTGRIAISTKVVDECVECRIEDDGCGIPAELLATVFEPLVSTKSFGVGLGLQLVQRLCLAHAAEIEIGNGPRGGTQVVLRIPLAHGPG